jgi:hypothetical protein
MNQTTPTANSVLIAGQKNMIQKIESPMKSTMSRMLLTLARMFHVFHVKRIVNPRRALAALLIMLGILFCGQAAQAQGTIPVALAQQVDVNGRPLIGALLYTYVAGTVSAPLVSFQDSALTIQNPWPLQADTTGRIPMLYLPAGSVHVRLTTSGGVVVFDYPAMLVIGGTTSGGTVAPGVPASAIFSTGDIKWRPAGGPLQDWVIANGLTIGDANSGATQRANPDTQALYVWLYANCPQVHCPQSSPRTGNALTDYGMHFQMTVPDMRGRGPFGLDDMGASASGRILAGNMTGSGDTPTTPNGVAGINNNIISQANLPNSPLSLTTTITDNRTWGAAGSGAAGTQPFAGLSQTGGITVPVTVTGGSISAATSGTLSGGGQGFSTIPNVLLGTWYLKL